MGAKALNVFHSLRGNSIREENVFHCGFRNFQNLINVLYIRDIRFFQSIVFQIFGHTKDSGVLLHFSADTDFPVQDKKGSHQNDDGKKKKA